MNAKRISIALGMAALSAGAAWAEDVLTGDPRLACEAILCLASGTRPAECGASLQRYFSISFRDFKDTVKARGDFLRLCPASTMTPEMASLVDAMANGAGSCDTASLNLTLRVVRWVPAQPQPGELSFAPMVPVVYISDQMPWACSGYLGHSYVSMGGVMPRYVGDPARGGQWVDAANYEAALAAYNERIAAEDAAAQATQRGDAFNWLPNAN